MPAPTSARRSSKAHSPYNLIRLAGGHTNLCCKLALKLESFRYSLLRLRLHSIADLVETALQFVSFCSGKCELTYAVARSRDHLRGLGIVMREEGGIVEAQFCAVDFAVSKAIPLNPLEIPRHWPEAPSLIVPDKAKELIT